MGYLSNTFNSIQFRITNDEKRLTPEDIAAALNQHRFHPIHETADEKSVGWVNFFDTSVSDFDASGNLHIGNHVAFALRVDQRKVPAAVLRERCREAENEFLAENPNFTKVPKQKREDIKDAQRAKLLTQLPPVPAVYDAVWNLDTGTVTFCHISASVIDLFTVMFKKTFEGRTLRLITPYDYCGLAAWEQGSLPRLLAEANKATTHHVLDIMKENEWIGQDFLLWLLHHGEDGGYTRPETTAFIDQKLLLAGAGDNGPRKYTFTGDQTKTGAVKAALASGCKIIVARIFMEAEENTWAFTLRGSNFELASYKCPPVRLEKDNTTDELMERQAVFLERVALVDKGREMFEGMLRDFLKMRLSPDWTVREADISEWMGGAA